MAKAWCFAEQAKKRLSLITWCQGWSGATDRKNATPCIGIFEAIDQEPRKILIADWFAGRQTSVPKHQKRFPIADARDLAG